MSNVDDLFQNQRNKIASMFLREEEIIQKSEWMKSFEEDSEIEKSEGARGGRVIGHTKSGKPIYENKKGSTYKNFSKQDHDDAATLHRGFKGEDNSKHRTLSDSHLDMTEDEGLNNSAK